MFYKLPIYHYPDGEGGGNPEPEPTNDANGGGNGNQQQDRTFTQSELDTILKERLDRANKSASQSLLESLGVESLDDVKNALGEFQKLKDSQLSESERLQKELDAQKAAAEQARLDAEKIVTQANERLMKAAVIEEASKSEYGIHENARPDVWLFIDKGSITMNDSGDFEGVKDALTKVLESRAYLKSEGTGKTPGTPKRNFSRGKRPPSNGSGREEKPAIRF